MKQDTLPKLLRTNYLRFADRKTAMRHKSLGIWKKYTWEECYVKIRNFCSGLISLGMKRGDKVSIIGENEPELFWAELAIQAGGGVMVGIFSDCAPQEISYYIANSDSKFVIAQDQEQVDKVLSIKGEVPLLKKVIYWAPKGLWNYEEETLLSFEQVLELGRDHDKKYPNRFDEEIDKGKKEDTGVICYTSGTTGDPKGVMLSQEWLVMGTAALAKMDGWENGDYHYLSFVPPAWAIEQLLGISGPLVAGVMVNFPEKPETVQENIREVGPHLVFYGARLWESVNRTIQARMMDSTLLRRWIYRIGMKVGLNIADMHHAGTKISPGWRFLYFLTYYSLIRSLRDRLGLSRAKVLYSAGGAISPEIIRYFKALDIDIKLFYGCTELGIVSMPRKNEIKPESCGTPTPWAKIKISGEGEILAKSKYMYSGYYKNEAATKSRLDKDGWYKTGDFGYIDGDGHLIAIDRMDDLRELANGKKFSPSYVEVRLRFSPFIKDVLIVGGKETGFVGALINIDLENAGSFAEKNQVVYTTFADLSQKVRILDLVKQEIAKVNSYLPEWNRVKRFVNLPKELDADEAELTRTRKLRRDYVEERYSPLISALYAEKDDVDVDTPVTYRDGRTGTIRTKILVTTL